MKYLLDTSTFLWWSCQSTKLSTLVLDLIKNSDNELYFSLACVREMQIKTQLGKLDLPAPVLDIIARQNNENGIQILPMTLLHMQFLTRIPNLHADPFDRMLVAQAIAENMTILTKDPIIAKYPVKVLW